MHMSRFVRKPAFCICENKDADQLRSNTARFVWDLVGNLEDWFSHNEAHIVLLVLTPGQDAKIIMF